MTLRTQLQADLDERIATLSAELAELRALKRRNPPHLTLVEPGPTVVRPRADRTRAHTLLVNDVCDELGNETDFRLAKMSPAGEPTASGRPQHCGPPGIADVCGVLAPHGRIVGLECKTGKAVQSKVQIFWMRVIRGLGGFYAVVRSRDDARAALTRARMGLNS